MIALLLLALLLPAQPDALTEAESLFALGHRLYGEGDFRGAAAAFEGAAKTGWTSPALELGLGAAYFEAGQLGRSVLHFERAHRLAPRDADVQHNLRLARDRVGGDTVSLTPSDAAARWLSAYVGADRMAIGLLGLYLAVLGLVGVRLWMRQTRQWLRRALVVLVPLLLFTTVAAVLTARYESRPHAVVVTDAAVVRTAPSNTAATAKTAPEGAVLTVTAERGPWRGVRCADGSTGWTEASTLEEI